MEKIVKSSRSYPLGKVDAVHTVVRSSDGAPQFLVFVKNCENCLDVLAYSFETYYLSRYKFPVNYSNVDISKFLLENGTFQISPARTFAANKKK